jgi:hypothetical protein
VLDPSGRFGKGCRVQAQDVLAPPHPREERRLDSSMGARTVLGTDDGPAMPGCDRGAHQYAALHGGFDRRISRSCLVRRRKANPDYAAPVARVARGSVSEAARRCRPCFEPRHSTDTGSDLTIRKPPESGRAFSRLPTGTLTLRTHRNA